MLGTWPFGAAFRRFGDPADLGDGTPLLDERGSWSRRRGELSLLGQVELRDVLRYEARQGCLWQDVDTNWTQFDGCLGRHFALPAADRCIVITGTEGTVNYQLIDADNHYYEAVRRVRRAPPSSSITAAWTAAPATIPATGRERIGSESALPRGRGRLILRHRKS